MTRYRDFGVKQLQFCESKMITFEAKKARRKINEAYQRIDIIVAKYSQSRLPHLPNNIFMEMIRWTRWIFSGRFIDEGRRLGSPTIFSF